MLVARDRGGWQDPSLNFSFPCLFFLFQEGWRDAEGVCGCRGSAGGVQQASGGAGVWVVGWVDTPP